MDDEVQIAFIILVHLDEVIAAAQGADAEHRPVQLHVLCAVQSLQIDIFHKSVGLGLNGKARGDILADQLVQLLQLDAPLP